MKPDELKDKIAKEDVLISDILSAIAEDNIQIYSITPKGKKKTTHPILAVFGQHTKRAC